MVQDMKIFFGNNFLMKRARKDTILFTLEILFYCLTFGKSGASAGNVCQPEIRVRVSNIEFVKRMRFVMLHFFKVMNIDK